MNTKQRIDNLWREFRYAINHAYDTADKARDDNGTCLRDYAENISWSDNLARLLGRETANERQHRQTRPSVPGFSNESAAKLIIMTQAVNGADAKSLPSSTGFLVYRQTAVESQVIGFLAKAFLSATWRDAVNSMDYAKLMQGK